MFTYSSEKTLIRVFTTYYYCLLVCDRFHINASAVIFNIMLTILDLVLLYAVLLHATLLSYSEWHSKHDLGLQQLQKHSCSTHHSLRWS